MGQSEIRVLVIELDGGGARAVLHANKELSTVVAKTFEAATELLAANRPEAVVVALGAPRSGDTNALKQLVTAAAGIPVMVLSQPVEEEPATQLLKTGISGYLFTQDARLLPNSVRELVRGGVPMSQPVSRLVLQRARRSSSSMAAVRPQSEAAQKLLPALASAKSWALLQRGHSYEDIGKALDLSVNTVVRSHLRVRRSTSRTSAPPARSKP